MIFLHNESKSKKIDWKKLETPLPDEEVQKRFGRLRGWKLVDNTLEKNYRFSEFKQAIEFVNHVARIAETENHHPSILIWNISNVKLTITTYDIAGLSLLDFQLAEKIDQK